MNPSHFSEGLQLMVEGGDAAATTIGLQAQVAVLQAAVQQQQHQLAAQQEVAQQQAKQLSLAAEAAEQRAEDLRAAYEKAEAEAAAAREKAETAIMQQQQQQQAGLDLCLVRIKLAGRFRASNYVPGAVRIARADNPPAGCRLIMGVLSSQLVHALTMHWNASFSWISWAACPSNPVKLTKNEGSSPSTSNSTHVP